MDCEGFQDLGKWCDDSDMAPTPIIDESFGSTYCNELLENCKMNEEESWGSYSLQMHPEYNSLNPIMPATPETNIVNTIPLPINYDKMTEEEIMISINENFLNYDSDIEIKSQECNKTDIGDEIYIDPDHYVVSDQTLNNGFGEVFKEYSIDNPDVDNIIELSDSEPCSFENDQVFNLSDHVGSHVKIDSPQTIIPACDIPTLSNTKLRNNILIDNVIINDNYEKEIETPILNIGNRVKHCPQRSLNLNFDQPLNVSDCPVTTPDVLRTVELLEFDSFSRTLNDVNVISETPTETAFHTTQDHHIETSLTLTPPDTPILRPRKRKNSDSDSNDSFISKKSSKRRRKSSTSVASYKTNRSSERFDKPVKVGRPPKQIFLNSPASSGYADDGYSVASPEDIYFVKRQRNNEASRRSRFNKKIKEVEMQEAADELERRNADLRIKIKSLELKSKRLKYLVFKPFLPKF